MSNVFCQNYVQDQIETTKVKNKQEIVAISPISLFHDRQSYAVVRFPVPRTLRQIFTLQHTLTTLLCHGPA